jgi:hypothetical protein
MKAPEGSAGPAFGDDLPQMDAVKRIGKVRIPCSRKLPVGGAGQPLQHRVQRSQCVALHVVWNPAATAAMRAMTGICNRLQTLNDGCLSRSTGCAQ